MFKIKCSGPRSDDVYTETNLRYKFKKTFLNIKYFCSKTFCHFNTLNNYFQIFDLSTKFASF